MTVVEAVVVDPMQPVAVTVTVAVPENELFQVTTPLEEIVPAAGVRLHVYPVALLALAE